jgi:hypothetical protein
MNSDRDRCLQLIANLHSKFNSNDLSGEDYEILRKELEDLINRIVLSSNKKLLEEIREFLPKPKI